MILWQGDLKKRELSLASFDFMTGRFKKNELWSASFDFMTGRFKKKENCVKQVLILWQGDLKKKWEKGQTI